MKDSNFNKLITLIRYLASAEGTTTAGRINILGMLLSVILAISLALAPLFETIVRLFHPNENLGAPIFEIFLCFCVFVCICTFMIGYLQGPAITRDMRKSEVEPRAGAKPKGKDQGRADVGHTPGGRRSRGTRPQRDRASKS